MKTIIKLKQHTPIIHFQHDQKGATMRASELKPKLDSFILDELHFIDNDLFENYRDIINSNFSKEKTPSRYSIHIRVNDTQAPQLIKFAPHFSNDERGELIRQGFSLKDKAPYFGDLLAIQHKEVELSIFSFNGKLLSLIKEALSYVLAYNNFGTRQSKGFGCFLPLDMDEERLKKLLLKKYTKIWETNHNGNPFELIHSTYQTLKSGINIPGGRYTKSKLFEYMCSKNIRWEKRKIKKQLQSKHSDIFKILKFDTSAVSNRIKDCDGANDNFNYKYIRALLGLAENNEYAVSHNKDNIKKVQIRIKDKNREIDRFRSPITFKVFKNKVYLLPGLVPKEMRSREFEFELALKYQNGQTTSEGSLFDLKTPDDFDLKDFLTEKLDPTTWNVIKRNMQ